MDHIRFLVVESYLYATSAVNVELTLHLCVLGIGPQFHIVFSTLIFKDGGKGFRPI